MKDALAQSSLSLKLLHRGKVRDVYEIDDKRLLIVTTDRLSAFDVVMAEPVPGKGQILNQMSCFWFDKTKKLIPNHLLPDKPADILGDEASDAVTKRSVVVVRTTPLKFEAVVRGYLSGSGWKDYCETGEVCGIALPPNLKHGDRLPEPIFTPATKAAVGAHDENVPFQQMADEMGSALANRVRDLSFALYRVCADYALSRGIIIADTKFEFGLTADNELLLIDEALTPDSSRFWSVDTWQPGSEQESFDKQFIRDYLESLDWDKKPPPPSLPEEIIRKTAEKYQSAWALLIQ